MLIFGTRGSNALVELLGRPNQGLQGSSTYLVSETGSGFWMVFLNQRMCVKYGCCLAVFPNGRSSMTLSITDPSGRVQLTANFLLKSADSFRSPFLFLRYLALV